ncbi:hypothetical protein BT96DRAFT_539069 [Gymnopus androsaceus JB14]|uniref:F-box domain-containing protein n=1 Tax=Gymnopus androsaceus JB14 TaxID=1447944 RepID=A0A6A4I006_9AGAR|nr:hypothetical protein BT96DRAFT_539069 [Gymnopus androsaceus JB14]
MLTLIESLTLPSLSDLTFINRVPARFAVGWPGYSIKLLLARSHCTITVLSLCQMSLSDKEAVALLEQVPFVKDLTIHEHRNPASDQDCPLTKALVQSLHGFTRTALHTSCQPLLPHLTSLSLVVREADKFDDLAFVEMISSRWLPHWDPEYAVEVGLACLQSVELVFYNRQEDLTAFSSLMHLEKAGLRIFVAKEKELQRKGYQRCALCS